jgi:hypothetical protein
MKKTVLAGLTAVLLIAGVFAQSTELQDLKTRIIELQNQGELGFQDFTLCSQILGYASFVPARESVIDKNGTLLIYYEPQNIFTVIREGIYEIWYTQDMAVLDEDGKEIIWEEKDLLNMHYMARKPILDMYAQNSLDLQGELPPGKYIFRAVLHDKLRNASVTKTLNFEIRTP